MTIRILPFAIIVSLLTVLVTWQTGQYARDWSLIQLKEQGEDRLLSTISEIRLLIGRYQHLPFLISQNRDVQQLLISSTPDRVASVSRFLEQTNLVAGSTAQFVLNRQGYAEAFSHWREQQDFYQLPHSERPYFQKAATGEQGLYIDLDDASSVGGFYLSAPVYDRGRFVGAATVRVDLERLKPELPQQEEYLLSYRQQILLASNSSWQKQAQTDLLTARRQEILSDGSEVDILELPDGSPVLMQSVQLDDLGWQVAVISRLQNVGRVKQQSQLYALGACIAFSLFLLFLRERHLKNLSRQETRRALEQHEAQQRDIINTAHVGLISLDSNGAISFINPMAMQQFGVSMPRVLGLHISDLIAPDVAAEVLRRTLSRLGSSSFAPITAQETIGNRSDHSRFPMLFSIKQMSREPEAVYLVTVIDITPRKRLERALQEANDQLESKVRERTRALEETQGELVQAEKMAALGRMSSAVVHELNQPLTALKTYVAICRQLIELHELAQLDGNLQLINDLTARMATITQQLKVFAFKKPEHLQPVLPADSLQQVVNLYRGRLEQQQISLEQDLPPQQVVVAADSARLEQVFVNLISNACDALQGQDNPRLKIAIRREGELAVITVKDSAGALDPHTARQMFEPFYTTKSIGQGLGLGLAIVRSIVQDLGGTIDACAEAGWSCFRITLPYYQPCDTGHQNGSEEDCIE